MTHSMYQASIPSFIHTLGSLSEILAKAEAYAVERKIDPAVLVNARLTPDMFPLSRQVQIATDIAKGGAARLAGVEVPSYADTETNFSELQQRVAKTIAFLKTISAAQVDGSEGRDVTLKAGPNTYHFKGQDYLTKFVLPNVYFHVTVAYSILRHNGVPVGKMDFLGNIQ